MRRKTSDVPALSRGLRILETLSQAGEPLTLSGIASALGTPVSSVQRMVDQLRAEEFILRSPTGGYYLGNKLFRIALDNGAHGILLTTAMPIMRRFVQHTAESVHLSVPVVDQFVVIGQLEGTGVIRVTIRPGSYHLPDYPSGKLLLSFGAPGADETLSRNLPEDEQVSIRTQRFAFAPSSVRRGVYHLSVPIQLSDGTCVAALASSFANPLDHSEDGRQRMEELLPPLTDGATEIARRIG